MGWLWASDHFLSIMTDVNAPYMLKKSFDLDTPIHSQQPKVTASNLPFCPKHIQFTSIDHEI